MSQVADTRTAEEIAESHPFLEWYGRMAARGITVWKKDVVLERSLSGRFVVGIEDDGELTLGILAEDVPHLLSIKWARANMVRNFRQSDWLVLISGEDIGIRFFIPMAASVAEKFVGYEGTTLRVYRSRFKDGHAAVAQRPQMEIPLTLTGF